ncbi:MAG: DUF2851 family protein [Bacteroidota bacterium]
MKEEFLYFLWQTQHFSHTGLESTDGEPLEIISAGKRNLFAGPDFYDCWLRTGNLRWNGPVEMHVKSSDWYAHRHQNDRAYNNVILHVVWQHDAAVYYPSGNEIPVLELSRYADETLLKTYKSMLAAKPGTIACGEMFDKSSRLSRFSMLDSALAERMHRKANEILGLFKRNREDWEETCYQILARALGLPLNAEPMLALAQLMPLRLLRKYGQNLQSLQALLLGQAGLLTDNIEKAESSGYRIVPAGLTKESIDSNLLSAVYSELEEKHSLKSTKSDPVIWKSGAQRPAGFIPQKILLLAELVYSLPFLSDLFLQVMPANAYAVHISRALNRKEQNFRTAPAGKDLFSGPAKPGKEALSLLVINTVPALLTAYGKQNDLPAWEEHALHVLESLPAEDNRILRQWKALGLLPQNAADSQGAAEKYNTHCSQRACLNCPVGIEILGRNDQRETEKQIPGYAA